jgi:hypothetical protein
MLNRIISEGKLDADSIFNSDRLCEGFASSPSLIYLEVGNIV